MYISDNENTLISSERRMRKKSPQYDSQLRIDKRMQNYYERSQSKDNSERNEYGLNDTTLTDAMDHIMMP